MDKIIEWSILHDSVNLKVNRNHQSYLFCKCQLANWIRNKMESNGIEPIGLKGPSRPVGEPDRELRSIVAADTPSGAMLPLHPPGAPTEDDATQPVSPEPGTDPFQISHVDNLVSMLILATKKTGQMDFPDKCECLGSCDCLTKKNRRIKLYNTRKFFAKDLVTTNEEGIKDYSLLIEHTKLIQEFMKDLLTCHQAFEMAKREFLDLATASERERIRAKDKEYEPKILKDPEAKAPKLSPEEKKIRDFMKLGLDRATAEKIIFAR